MRQARGGKRTGRKSQQPSKRVCKKARIEQQDSSKHKINDAIIEASEKGDVDAVRRLLQDRNSCNPSAQSSEAIHLASKNGHVQVVRLLLEDKRADPSAKR